MRLAALFSDHMVLQRDHPLPVWGWAKPGETVTVELAGKSAQATAGADGRWQVQLPALPAGGPHVLIARGRAAAAAKVSDILVGDVWICSGQSNMEWPLEMTQQSDQALAEADYPQMRLFTVPKRTEAKPVSDIDAAWGLCTPLGVVGFSGVAYYFGRELHRRLKVPIGLINTSWGGTPAQAWTSRETLQAEPKLAGYIEELRAQELPPDELRRRNIADRAEFQAKLPQDAGNRGFAQGWAKLEFNDADWGSMKLPEYWVNAGHPTNGVFWFRKTVDVPAAWAGQPLQLSLGAVDKSDDTYVNGVRVGGMNWAQDQQSWSTPRNYPVPAGVLKAGRNVIAVRVLSNYTGGGITGPGLAMVLHPPENRDDSPIKLAGMWQYKIEQDFGRVTGISEPKSLFGSNSPTLLFNGMIAPLIP
ncbi:MAG TPA: sialate O-acetylesterase, partial [Planctomycetota bacterium]|nr:sialate O-acetylesterase [Planctomycetota bacterium]